MRYPEKMLSEGEEIVFDVRHHPLVVWRPLALVLCYMAAWLALLFNLDFFGRVWPLLVGSFLLLLLLVILLWRTEVWLHVNLVLTNYQLVYLVGVFSRRSWGIPISKITDVSLSQGFLGRIVGIGDLVIKSSGERGQTPYFRLRHPDRLKQKILEQVRLATDAAAGVGPKAIAEEVARTMERRRPTQELATVPPERPPLYSEIVDQIERVEELRRRGVLSDEEFREAKDGLLSRLGREPDN